MTADDGPAPETPSHFPGYDVLARASTWDPVTTGVVLRRLGPLPATRFFTLAEEATARALLDRLLAQDAEPRVPLRQLVDTRLAEGETDGWRYQDMPEDGQAWRTSLRCLDEDASTRGRQFAALDRQSQVELLDAVRVADQWHGLPAKRVWGLWTRYACAAFYSHPLAWNEIGFGGPAYPVGYKALGIDGREPWEPRERDALDPEPWSRRREAALARHRAGSPATPAGSER